MFIEYIDAPFITIDNMNTVCEYATLWHLPYDEIYHYCALSRISLGI